MTRINHEVAKIHISYTRLGNTEAEYDGVNENGFFSYKVWRNGKYCNYTFAPELVDQYLAIMAHMEALVNVSPRPTSKLTQEELSKIDAAIMPMDEMRAAAQDGRIAKPGLKEYFDRLDKAIKNIEHVDGEVTDGANKDE